MTKITMGNNSEKTVEQTFEDFIKHCKIKNLSTYTLYYYERCYKKFNTYFDTEKPIKEVTKDIVDDYILFLKDDDNLNNVSANTCLRGLRAILYYAMDLGYIPKIKIHMMKVEKPIKPTYTDEELALLLKKPIIRKSRFTEYRNWVLVNYLLGTGNRISTANNIQIQDLDFENDCIILRITKNKRQQIIPMGDTLKGVLIEYLTYRQGEPEDYLFCDEYGNQVNVDSLKQAIAKYNKRRGVMKTSCHLFRHTFAKKYILAEGSMFKLQKLLGHSSLDMVRNYVNMFSDDLQDGFDKYNALDQLVQKKDTISLKKKGR